MIMARCRALAPSSTSQHTVTHHPQHKTVPRDTRSARTGSQGLPPCSIQALQPRAPLTGRGSTGCPCHKAPGLRSCHLCMAMWETHNHVTGTRWKSHHSL